MSEIEKQHYNFIPHEVVHVEGLRAPQSISHTELLPPISDFGELIKQCAKLFYAARFPRSDAVWHYLRDQLIEHEDYLLSIKDKEEFLEHSEEIANRFKTIRRFLGPKK